MGSNAGEFIRMLELIRQRIGRHFGESGQGLAEYALILALIAIVAIVALLFLGSQVSRILSTVGTSL
jgi:pilus assembly protein Flp/PilA